MKIPRAMIFAKTPFLQTITSEKCPSGGKGAQKTAKLLCTLLQLQSHDCALLKHSKQTVSCVDVETPTGNTHLQLPIEVVLDKLLDARDGEIKT